MSRCCFFSHVNYVSSAHSFPYEVHGYLDAFGDRTVLVNAEVCVYTIDLRQSVSEIETDLLDLLEDEALP